MTDVKASCPMCGDIVLDADDVNLVTNSIPERSFYAFTCTGCHDRIVKPACPDIVKLLTLGQVPTVHVTVPAEALEEHHGPPITIDEVLDVILELRDRP